MHIRPIDKTSKRIALPPRSPRRADWADLDPNLARALHDAIIHRLVR